MPNSIEDRKRAITRLRRIKGQAEALERAVTDGVQCGQCCSSWLPCVALSTV